jgi:hypothetical protein
VEAIAGEPFGVGRLVIDIPDHLLPQPLGAEGLGLSEKNGRVFYPVVRVPVLRPLAKEVLESTPVLTGGPVRQEVRDLLTDLLDQPTRKTIYFLFRGSEPLLLTLRARRDYECRAVVRPGRLAYRRLMAAWWEQYTAPPRLLQPPPDYPPLVENFLKATLARRLNLRLPKREHTASPRQLLQRELAILAGTESIRLAMAQDRVLGLHNLHLPADQPLPEPMSLPGLVVPEPPPQVTVEPIALCVPPECYYVRFGSFDNALWLKDTLANYGGDLQNLLAARGLDYELGRRMETQLVLKQTVLARLLGSAVISDVAMVGTDFFFREGGAYGMLFHAKSNLMLSGALAHLRAERLRAGGASEQQLQIGRHRVSYLSSADGTVRSCYAALGDFHFVTTSKTLAQRFLEVAEGGVGLGATQEFRHARALMPIERNDTVWIYLSDAFFRNLTSPRYRIEMARRLQALADIEIVRLARLMATSEGNPADTVEELVSGAMLPPNFARRPDGSHVVLKDGEVFDSLRGRRGVFVPVPDVPVTTATRAEVSEYRQFGDFFREQWQRMDPTIVAIKRQPLEGGRERISIEMRLSPFAAEHFRFLDQWAGPPDNKQMAPVPGDIARGELALKNQHLFAGIRDVVPSSELATPRDLLGTRLRDVLVGYIGTTGEVGLLGFLERPLLFPSPEPDKPQVVLGVARQRADNFRVFSFHPEVLAEVVPQLRFEEAPRPAQLRLWIGDISQAKIARLVNNLAYSRTVETSLGNLRLLHALEHQLHVPAPRCLETAELLLGAKLVCPLGGKYAFPKEPRQTSPIGPAGPASQSGHWTSTALVPRGKRPLLGQPAPPDYLAPPLNWFRGLKLDATMNEKVLSGQAEVIMQTPVQRPAPAADGSREDRP